MQNINYAFLLSRPVWGAWIEIPSGRRWRPSTPGRAPYGARGLKFLRECLVAGAAKSRPVWGAWIEIAYLAYSTSVRVRRAPDGARGLKFTKPGVFWCAVQGRAPYGARGLKFVILPGDFVQPVCRAPYGARGLKFLVGDLALSGSGSRPVWGAWIEICSPGYACRWDTRRAPYGARGLKSLPYEYYYNT